MSNAAPAPGRSRNNRHAARHAISLGGCEIVLLPAAAYDVCYTPTVPTIGFAFDAQDGTHAFASDRRRPFRTRPNSLAYIPAACEVSSRSASGGEYITISLARDDAATRPEQRFNDRIDRRAIAAAETLRRIILLADCFDALEVEREISALCEAVCRADSPSGSAPAERWMTARRLKRVDEVIEAGISSPLPVQGIAAALGLSPGFFNRSFKAAVGKTPHDYILDRRVSRARALIASTDTELARVAGACGFASQAHMTTQLRRRLGVTPGALRLRSTPAAGGLAP